MIKGKVTVTADGVRVGLSMTAVDAAFLKHVLGAISGGGLVRGTTNKLYRILDELGVPDCNEIGLDREPTFDMKMQMAWSNKADTILSKLAEHADRKMPNHIGTYKEM